MVPNYAADVVGLPFCYNFRCFGFLFNFDLLSINEPNPLCHSNDQFGLTTANVKYLFILLKLSERIPIGASEGENFIRSPKDGRNAPLKLINVQRFCKPNSLTPKNV